MQFESAKFVKRLHAVRAALCQPIAILRIGLVALSGTVMVMHAVHARPGADAILWEEVVDYLLAPAAAGTSVLLLLTMLVAELLQQPCAPRLIVVWDTVVLAIWTMYLCSKVIFTVPQFMSLETDLDEEIMLIALVLVTTVGHVAETVLAVGVERREHYLRVLEALRQEIERRQLEYQVQLRRQRELLLPPPNVHFSELPGARVRMAQISDYRFSLRNSFLFAVQPSSWNWLTGPLRSEESSQTEAFPKQQSEWQSSEEELRLIQPSQDQLAQDQLAQDQSPQQPTTDPVTFENLLNTTCTTQVAEPLTITDLNVKTPHVAPGHKQTRLSQGQLIQEQRIQYQYRTQGRCPCEARDLSPRSPSRLFPKETLIPKDTHASEAPIASGDFPNQPAKFQLLHSLQKEPEQQFQKQTQGRCLCEELVHLSRLQTSSPTKLLIPKDVETFETPTASDLDGGMAQSQLLHELQNQRSQYSQQQVQGRCLCGKHVHTFRSSMSSPKKILIPKDPDTPKAATVSYLEGQTAQGQLSYEQQDDQIQQQTTGWCFCGNGIISANLPSTSANKQLLSPRGQNCVDADGMSVTRDLRGQMTHYQLSHDRQHGQEYQQTTSEWQNVSTFVASRKPEDQMLISQLTQEQMSQDHMLQRQTPATGWQSTCGKCDHSDGSSSTSPRDPMDITEPLVVIEQPQDLILPKQAAQYQILYFQQPTEERCISKECDHTHSTNTLTATSSTSKVPHISPGPSIYGYLPKPHCQGKQNTHQLPSPK